MTYSAKGLARWTVGVASAAGRSNVSRLWGYRTADTLAAVMAAQYFDDAYERLNKGDVILAICSVGGTPTMAQLQVTASSASGVSVVQAGIQGAGSGYKIARGQSTTVAASDTIATGLASVVAVIATLNDAPVAGCQFVTADIGDQAGAPAAGSFLLKTWKATASGDTTQIAATTFGKKVNWIAIGI